MRFWKTTWRNRVQRSRLLRLIVSSWISSGVSFEWWSAANTSDSRLRPESRFPPRRLAMAGDSQLPRSRTSRLLEFHRSPGRSAGVSSLLRNSTEDEEGGTNHALVAERRHEKGRHGSAGKAKVEQIESASADGTSFVTDSSRRLSRGRPPASLETKVARYRSLRNDDNCTLF